MPLPSPGEPGHVLPLPPNAPRVPPSRFSRWLGRTILRLGGWRMAGAFPDIPKLVLIGAPHSSNWDGLWGFAAKLALGLDIRILGKHQLFWWPLGALLRRLGVIAQRARQEAAKLIGGEGPQAVEPWRNMGRGRGGGTARCWRSRNQPR